MAETDREMQGVPDPSFAALMDRLRRRKAPRLALVMLKYLQKTGPMPASEVKDFLNLSDRSVTRYENALLEADALNITFKWDPTTRGRRKVYAVNLSSDTLASAS